jgi:zinc D-Ala-D-Ala carboxypeptidase
MNLSEHFTLEEATLSETAARLGIVNLPSEEVQLNMMFAAVCLEKLRAFIGKSILITSWYRSPTLNLKIPGSSKTSAHTLGYAIDCNIQGITPLNLCKISVEFFNKNNIIFDQIIHEYGRWMHVSFDPRGRKECLTIFKNDLDKKYLSGLLTESQYKE